MTNTRTAAYLGLPTTLPTDRSAAYLGLATTCAGFKVDHAGLPEPAPLSDDLIHDLVNGLAADGFNVIA
jgi:hypothetical protein